MLWYWKLAIYVLVVAARYVFRPKPPKSPMADPWESTNYPEADVGSPIPVVFGTRWVLNANVLWYGHLKTWPVRVKQSTWISSFIGGLLGGGGGTWITLGQKYYIGMHLGICRNPIDALQKIKVETITIYDDGDITENDTISIDMPEAFGGERQQGGIVGDVDIEFGESDQTENAYLQARLGANIPAFRGIVCAVLNQVYVAALTPAIRPWEFLIQWLDSAAAGPNSLDMNPAHIIELLLTEEWGLGIDAGELDTDSFTDAADQLDTEEIGLSFLWLNTIPVEEIIGEILHHIMGVLYTDPETGKFVLRLLRQDDAVAMELQEGYCLRVNSYERPLFSELVNQVIVHYTDREEQEQIITLHNQGLIAQMGTVISRDLYYDLVVEPETAQKIAARDLRNLSLPLAAVELVCDRQALDLRIGDIVTLSWARYDLESARFRITWIDYGNLQDGEIRIQALEDFWGVDTALYAEASETEWEYPYSEPAASPYRKIFEAPYYLLVQKWGDSAVVWDAIDDDAGWLEAAAARPSDDASTFQLWTREFDPYAEAFSSAFTPTATLDDALVKEITTTTTFTATSDVELVAVNTYCLIDDEICEVTALDAVTGDITLKRGVLDTVPATHAEDARIFFGEDWTAGDPTGYDSGSTVYAKCLPTTSLGTLSLADAPEDSLVFADRFFRPYPPGDFKINTERWPAFIVGEVSPTWAHRDRLQQTSGYTAQDAAGIGPEFGTTYTIEFYSELDVLQRTISGLSSTTYTYPIAEEISDSGLGRPNETMEVVLYSVRDGAVSWQSQAHVIPECRGWGMFYGEYWGE